MEKWLTTTIPGIVLLGAAGSILAVGILAALRLIPMPMRWHRRRVTKQAFMLGYSAATVEHDETGRKLVAFMSFHISLMMVYLTAFLFCGILFSIVIAIQPETTLTWSTFLSSAAAFTLAYLAYFEFEYINKTYEFYWKSPLRHAASSFSESEAKRNANGNSRSDNKTGDNKRRHRNSPPSEDEADATIVPPTS